MCAPHHGKTLQHLGILEVSASAIIDDSPVVQHAVGNIRLEVWEVLGTPHGDLKCRHRIERIATIGGAQAEAKAHGVVASLYSGNHADLLPPPIADILEDNIVGRISHNGADVGLCLIKSQELLFLAADIDSLEKNGT